MTTQHAVLNVSDEWLLATRMTAKEMALELAIHLYELQKISLGKASELAGLTRVAFQQILAGRNIALNYDIHEYKTDVKTLRKLKRIR